jgi:hypothetical protein
MIVAIGSCSANTAKGIFGSNKGSSSYSQSSQNFVSREKLKTSGSFDSGCIVDELGWFDDVKSSAKELKTFYDKTGVQPYILLLQYDSSLDSDEALEDYSMDYYIDNIVNEDSFLFVYMDGASGDFGNYKYVVGDNAIAVMDYDAIDIFFDYLDSYWDTNMSTDDLFTKAFNNTASDIMTTTTSESGSKGNKVVKNIFIIIILIIAALLIAKYFKKKKESPTASDNTPKPEDEAKDNPNILN